MPGVLVGNISASSSLWWTRKTQPSLVFSFSSSLLFDTIWVFTKGKTFFSFVLPRHTNSSYTYVHCFWASFYFLFKHTHFALLLHSRVILVFFFSLFSFSYVTRSHQILPVWFALHNHNKNPSITWCSRRIMWCNDDEKIKANLI